MYRRTAAVSMLGLGLALILGFTSEQRVPPPHDIVAGTSVLPPGSALPSDAECAAGLRRDPWEPRPENGEANSVTPSEEVRSRTWGGPPAEVLHGRVTGAFRGTTDEIIRWASCKWGFAPDLTRAQAVQESSWRQSARGDGGVSFGLLQIKSTVWTGTHPWSELSTAYNIDWSLGMRRACYEGLLFEDASSRGDLWGCIGAHYSGAWYDEGAVRYINDVRAHLERRPWREWPSSAGTPPE